MANTLWQAQLTPTHPGFWLLLAAALWLLSLIVRRWIGADARQLVASARRLLIPYAALLIGAVSPRLMGLSRIDWEMTISFGLTVVVILVVGVGLAALQQRGGHSTGTLPADAGARRVSGLPMQGAIEQFYWCFVRGALAEILLTVNPDATQVTYWAGWLAAAFVLPDTLTEARSTGERLGNVTALVVTTVLFIYTRNFWLCAAAHIAVVMIFDSALFSPGPDGLRGHSSRGEGD